MKNSDLSKRCLTSKKLGTQICGAALKRWWLWVIFAACLIPLVTPSCAHVVNSHWRQALRFVALTAFVAWAVSVCQTLTIIFNLRKQETGITWCQILILVAIGLWIIGFLFIFRIQNEDKSLVLFGLIGALMTWIFQDKVKGVVTFIHLRSHHLLNIDDWIQVPKYNVDGEVKRVTLTTVTIYNWDTTTSIIPISALHSDHFINLQNMSRGKTYGRRMYMSFTMDTRSFHSISNDEVDQLKNRFKTNNNSVALPEAEIHEGVLNAQLYRLYLYHWLMSHPHISQQPRLIVRWMEQKEGGMPLQVYAFIIDSRLDAFEWQQSQIVEHIIESLEWFGLRLYQSPTGYDVSKVDAELAAHR